MKPDLSIIIPTKDRESILHQTLESAYRALEHLNGEVIVVNDSDQPLQLDAYPQVRLTKNPKAGVASARNHGASIASADFIIFMDDDFLVDEEALRLILQLHKEHPNRIYLLNWEYPSDTLGKMKHTQFGRFLVNQQWTSLRGWLRSEHWRDDQPFEIPSGASYFLPLRKDIFEKIGGYNEKFPMAGFEDYDLPKRLMKEGFRFYIYPQKTIYHNESDRGELKAFLARRKRSAITQKVAVDIGYKELAIPYSKSKSTILKGLSALSPALIRTVELIPNHPAFDSIYTKLTNTLITIKIYEGYTHEHIH